jgi:Uma2 family endonuclease
MLHKYNLIFSDELRFTDEEFFKFCQENRNLRIERNKKGEIIIMSPSGSFTSHLNFEILMVLGTWNKKSKRKGVVFDSSAGFTLSDDSVLYPDVSWIENSRWNQLTIEEKERFAPICPDFVVELMSPSDNLKEAKAKMLDWMQNGCQLAWLIHPEKEEVWIYRANGEVINVKGFDKKLSGEQILEGFELDLSILKEE